MAMTRKLDSPRTFDNLASRQGGSFFLNEDKSYLSYDNGYTSLARSLRTNKGLLFKFSIFNYHENKEEVELGLLINPTDITIGQSFVASSSYTRQALLATLWGSQQQTISCAGTSPAFFIGASTKSAGKLFESGLTTRHRKETLGFINFLSLVAMYKNNGNYFLDGDQNASLFNNKSGYGNKGRVIGVMDSILLTYDGSEYVGSFNAFTLDEDPARPFNLRYNFEFIVSCMRGDAMDGHLRMNGNDIRTSGEPQIPISIQGRNVVLTTTVGMSTKDLNETFKIYHDPYAQTFDEYLEKQKGEGSEETGDDTSEGTSESGASGSSSSGRVPIAADGGRVKDTSGAKIASIASNSGAGKFSTNSTPTVVKLYGQKVPGNSGITYSQFITKAATECGLSNVDPVLLTTILTVEAGSNIKLKNGIAVPSTNVVGDKGRSKGITQIYNTTYSSLSQKDGFSTYMRDMGFEGALNHDRCRTDPSYSIAVTMFLLKENRKATGSDSVKEIVAYNGYPSLYKSSIASVTARYVNTYEAIRSNQTFATAIDAKF